VFSLGLGEAGDVDDWFQADEFVAAFALVLAAVEELDGVAVELD
jgi:hypothetical protein